MNPNQSSFAKSLPDNFDGVFRFTNWTAADFTSKWGGKEYKFPAYKTTPIVMPNQTPIEIQNIRKKFAKELAEREFFKVEKVTALNKKNENVSFQGAVSYTENDLAPMIQKCLDPLPPGQAEVRDVPKVEIKPKAMKRLKSRESGDDETDSLVPAGSASVQ